MTRYHLYLSNEEQGPYTLYQLKAMWESGTVTLDTLYRTDDIGTWFPLSMIAETLEKKNATQEPLALVTPNRAVSITDIEMKFVSMVVFMVKAVIASIPATIILFCLFLFFSFVATFLFGGFLSTLLR